MRNCIYVNEILSTLIKHKNLEICWRYISSNIWAIKDLRQKKIFSVLQKYFVIFKNYKLMWVILEKKKSI